ncbi:MAG: hypothetical protein KFB96_14040 [Thiocapsa sp.]|uniref:hypothetical protein n=1 Tax=Thiocapsa sp. TaxID=2024551 RepID=UPI001BCE2764|nr:hypothetical protein [Thiocapsa sp.]QVL46870.1 MAG: hypothetical protein KFB96_14040 [Thiocapsa sp.]
MPKRQRSRERSTGLPERARRIRELECHIGYTADGIGESTILDAQKSGIYPLRIERVVADVA